MYNRVTDAIISELSQIVGAENILIRPDAMEPYTHDHVTGLRADPELVLKVRSTAEIAEILRLAQRENIPVTPRGAGYGLSGGAVPVVGGIVLSLERMTRILEIDLENLITVGGGITGDLAGVLSAGLFYPPDPASLIQHHRRNIAERWRTTGGEVWRNCDCSYRLCCPPVKSSPAGASW
jgi:glycolate oxidase